MMKNNLKSAHIRAAGKLLSTALCQEGTGSMTTEHFTLDDAPVGLLKTVDGVIILKTEYRSKSGAIDAYIVESGEYFWGSQPQTPENQLKELVVRHSDMLAAPAELRNNELYSRADAEAAQARVAILEKEKARWDWVKSSMALAVIDAILDHIEEKGGCVPGGISSDSIDAYIDSFIAAEVTT